MNETLQNWTQKDPIAAQNLALRTPDAIPGSTPEIGTGGIVVERLFDDTGNEAIKLYVDTTNNDWQETAIGMLRVGNINTKTVRGKSAGYEEERRSVRIWFKQDVRELLSYGKGQFGLIEDRFRDIPLNEEGIGWDELGRKNKNGEKKEKFAADKNGFSRPLDWHKWLIVDTGTPQSQHIRQAEVHAVAAD